MKVSDIFEGDFSVRKTVWQKRGEKITRREIDTVATGDIAHRSRIEITDDGNKKENADG